MGAPSVKVCPPDPVEKYWPNSNYGNARILKAYADYPMREPVWAVIPHGVFYEDDYVFPGEAEARVPAVLQYPAHRDECWGKHKIVVPSAAPFLYALDIFPHAPARKGTLVMPQHTTTLFDMEFDWWAFSESLNDLPKPVTVLLYYNDVQQDVHRYFPRFTVKTCGHVNNQDFMKHLVWRMTGAEYVVSNEVGSYTYYALAAGCKFNLIGPPPRFVLNQQGIDNGFEGVFHNSENRHPEEKRRLAEVTALVTDWTDEQTPEQIEAWRYYLRADEKKSPEALNADLQFCKSLHGLTREQRLAIRANGALAPTP